MRFTFQTACPSLRAKFFVILRSAERVSKDERPQAGPPILRSSLRSHLQRQRRSRCAGMTDYNYNFAISRREAPEVLHFVVPLEEKRAQGRPGARCTRGLMCVSANKNVHMSIQVQLATPGLPCAMALRLIRFRPGDRLSCHHRQLGALAPHELDASTGASDPNDFAVRNSALVYRTIASIASHRTS
jgi:hypothetical protein